MSRIFKFFRNKPILRVVIGILGLWLLGSLAMWVAESDNPAFSSLPKSFWNLMVYLTSGFEGDQPLTAAGKLIGVTVVILGLALVGVFTATIASVFVEKTLRRGKGMDTIKIKNHVVICGWNPRAEKIIRELHAPVVKKNRRAIVVINYEGDNMLIDDNDPAFDDVFFIAGDPTHERVLLRAGVRNAHAAVVLADRTNLDLADARSILIALAIEAINAEVHTLVEVVHSDNLKHFAHTKVDECISMDHLGELLLSQAAMNHGISEFFTELLTFQEYGNEVYHVSVPDGFVGKDWATLARSVLHMNMIAVGIQKNGSTKANPPHDTVLEADDKILVISRDLPDISKLQPDEC